MLLRIQANVQSVLNKLIQKAGYSQDRIKWRVTKDLPTLPQCVQALENDYTFFTRLLAKYGLIYWFECHDFIESIVIAEGNLASPYIERGLLSVTDKDGLVHEHETGFVGFTQCQSRHRFKMGGSQVHMNAHPPTSVSSAQRSYFEPAAQNPAEQFERTGNLELAYQQGKNEVTLVGNVAEANAGYSFSLNGKLGTAKGGDYTCIRSKQVYKQGSANDPKQVAHHSESVCVPRGEPIRIAPPEHSPKPMVFTATVRSLSGSKANPHLDAQGQYATQVHFDSQVTESVKRLTQYACRGQKQPTGLHFPLLPDSNVLIGCMNNDPDQSYLLGFALNDTQPSVVTSANNAQNVLCSRGQNLLMFDDTPKTPHIVLQTLAGNQHLVLHGDKKQPYIHWLAQLGAMNIFAAKDIQLGSVKSAIRLLTNKTFIASAKQQLALESKKSVIADAATNLDVTANQIDASAKQNITLKAGRSHRSVIQSDINLKADNNLTITAPAGSQLIQSQGNITVKGSGSGNLTLANGGSEISIDSSGNVNIFADKLLTLKGKAMTVFDGSMEQDIGGKQSATMPSVPQIAQIAANQRLSLTADGAASLADKTIDLSYFYSDGTPVEDIDYEVVMDNGKIYTGQLSGGTAEVIDVPAGNYTVSYIGEDEEKIISLRQELRTALDQMVAEIRKQADIQERLIDDENLGMQGLIYSGAFLYGLYQQGESIVTGVADLVEGTVGAIYDVGAATFRILGHLATGDVEAIRAELQQIMSTASESINGIVEAFETLVIIAEDEEARTLLANFPARYFNAHSSVERTRMAGRLSFEILLALATFGSGAVVSAIAKSNYFVKATRALEKLTQATKLKRLNYTRSGTTEKVQLDRIRKLDTSIRDVKKINHGPSIRITAEKHRTSSRLNTRQWKHKTMFDGRLVHQRNDLFDINKKDLNGLTNLERMMKGRPPIGFDGEPVNLHHLIQKEPGTIAEVGGKLHSERTKILHIPQYEKRNGAWLKRKNYSFRAHNGRKSTWPSTQFGNIKKTEAEKIFIKWSSEYWKYRAKGF